MAKKASGSTRPRTQRRAEDRARKRAVEQTADVRPVRAVTVAPDGRILVAAADGSPKELVAAGAPFRFLPVWFRARPGEAGCRPCYDFVGCFIPTVDPAASDGLGESATISEFGALRFEGLELPTGMAWVHRCSEVYRAQRLPLYGMTWEVRSLKKDRNGSIWWGYSIRDPKAFQATSTIWRDVRATYERLKLLDEKGALEVLPGPRGIVVQT